MKIHYFQRYHSKENVATANTMLLLSRLYSYSSDKFFQLLRSEFFADSFDPEITFNLQEKSIDSVPDAVISQEGFKLVVETKMYDWFYSDQLERHLNAFKDEKNKVLITLAPELMNDATLNEFEGKLKEYNKGTKHPVIHINTTFESLAHAIQEVIDERDYEIQDVLDDYLNYCYTDELIPRNDVGKFMRMQLAGTTFDFNLKSGVYYDKADHGYRAHKYLGLYKNKSIRAVGSICATITAIEENGILKFNQYKQDFGEITDERKKIIEQAIEDAEANYGYDLRSVEHRYFFVDIFYEMDFQKSTPRAPMGTRIFDLSQYLKIDDISDTKELAEQLSQLTWQ